MTSNEEYAGKEYKFIRATRSGMSLLCLKSSHSICWHLKISENTYLPSRSLHDPVPCWSCPPPNPLSRMQHPQPSTTIWTHWAPSVSGLCVCYFSPASLPAPTSSSPSASAQMSPPPKSQSPPLTALSNVTIEYLLPSPSLMQTALVCLLACVFACLVLLPLNYQLQGNLVLLLLE